MKQASLIQNLIASAEKHRSRTAFYLSSPVPQAWSYEQLVSNASYFAQEINRTTQKERVAFLCKNKPYGYLSILGSLLCGKTYIPLNVNYPIQRNRFILSKTGVDTLILDPECECDVQLRTGIKVISPKTNGIAPLPTLKFIENKNVYLLFTSGSTGEPKGVPISNENLCHYLKCATQILNPTPEDRFSGCFDFTFDLSAHDMFLCWLSGACLFPLSEADRFAPYNFINESKLSFWFSVPSVITNLIKLRLIKKSSFPTLKTSLFCGEKLEVSQAKAWKQAAPHSKLFNFYGPTETTVAISSFEITSDFLDSNPSQIPIGKIFPDHRFKLLPSGKGELCLAGPQVALEYWENQEETEKRFLTDGKQPWYKTGDLVEADPKGNLIFIGRNDTQIKINGFRVELQEIESVLRKIPGVLDAIVFTYPRKNPEFLAACLLSEPKNESVIFERCRATLPPYMVPHHFIYLNNFTTNVNGKIDRNKTIEEAIGELENE